MRVIDEINRLDATDAGQVIDAFDKFTSGELQGLHNAIGHAQDIDRIVALALFGPGVDQLFHRESRESLIDRAIARLESIKAEADAQNPPLPEAKRKRSLLGLGWLRSWLWKLYEITIKAAFEAMFKQMNRP